MKRLFSLGLFFFCCLSWCCLLSFLQEACSAPLDKGYLDWLDQIGAKDVLADYFSRVPGTPEQILKAARLFLQQNQYNKVISLLKERHFANGDFEFKRLWLLFQATKRTGGYPESLAYLAELGSFPLSRTKILARRKYLDVYLRSVCLEIFWSGKAWSGKARSLRKNILSQAISLGRQLWPGDPFIRALGQATGNQPDLVPPLTHQVLQHSEPALQQGSAELIACLVLDNRRLTEAALNKLPSGQREFWVRFANIIQDNSTESLPDQEQIAPLARAFLEFYALELKALHLKLGVAADNPRWKEFLVQLSSLSPELQLARVQNELRSPLIVSEDKSLLNQYYLALLILNNDRQSLARFLKDNPLPRNKGLLFALCLTEQLDINTFLTALPDAGQRSLFINLCRAAGMDFQFLFSGFWEKKLQIRREQWPLDQLCNYTLLQQTFTSQPSPALAQEIILCFPDSPLSARALYFLATKTLQEEKNYSQALSLLSRIADPLVTADILRTKADILLNQGKKRQAFELYHRLIISDPGYLSLEKRLKVAVLAQELGLWNWAEVELDRLWQKRQALSPALQAEIIFWRAEGFQARNLQNKALENYLFLAWHYPQENIWALTALYRAALIYEQRGMLHTAQILLKKVIKKADRKSQKKAAEDRIRAIRARERSSRVSRPTWLWIF